jgi:hypothetical protein
MELSGWFNLIFFFWNWSGYLSADLEKETYILLSSHDETYQPDQGILVMVRTTG